MPNYHAQANTAQKLESTSDVVFKQRRPQDTVLYQVIADHLEWWLAEEKNSRFPNYVQREFAKFLKCGIPEHGFLQSACDQCRARTIVPFSCKLRGFCSSCCTKRSLETTDHLTKLVLPSAPVRQWVFTFPFALRVWMARTPGLLNEVHAIVYKSLLDFYRAKGVKWGVGEADYGGLTFIQRFGSNLALNVHFHVLVPEAAFIEAGDDAMMIYLNKITSQDVADVLERVSQQIIQHLIHRGYLKSEPDDAHEFEADNTWNRLLANSVAARLGEKVGKGFGNYGEPVKVSKLRAKLNNFTLHAGVWISECKPKEIRRLIRYTSRGPIAQDQLSLRGGRVVLKLRRPYSDGTKEIHFDPDRFLSALAGIIPTPWTNQIRFWGVFAPNHRLRRLVTKSQRRKNGGQKTSYRIAWAELLKQTFGIDRTRCDCCGGHVRMISVITNQSVVDKILRSMASSGVPPPHQ